MTELSAPRQQVTIGAAVVVVGGALVVLGTFLNWFDLDGASFNGFTSGLEAVTNIGTGVFVAVGLVIAAAGIAQLVRGRLVALGIVGAVAGATGLLLGMKVLSDIDDLVAFGRFFGSDVSTGPGVYVSALGAIIALGGSLATVAARRA